MLAAWACIGSAGAQVMAQGVEQLDRQQTEQERLREMLQSRPKAYEDKVMDPSLPADVPEEEFDPEKATGLRTWVVESRMSQSSSDDRLDLRPSRELGMSFQYQHETVNYGAFVAQVEGNDRRADGFDPARRSGKSRITVRNIALPVGTGWFADSAAGDQFSEVTTALARTYRLSLGSVVVRGLSTRLYSADGEFRLGTGEIGALTGSPYFLFQRSRGHLSWLGLSRRLTPEWSAGLQLNRSTDLAPVASQTTPAAGDGEDMLSSAIGLSYRSDPSPFADLAARLMVLGSRTSAPDPARSESAYGLASEAAFLLGGLRHEAGAYFSDGRLRFSDAVLGSDSRGLYWRMNSATSRFSWSLGAHADESGPLLPGPDALRSHSLGLNAGVQYRFSRYEAVLASVSLGDQRQGPEDELSRELATRHRTVQAGASYETRFGNWPTSRFRAAYFRNAALVANGARATGEEVEWSQDWLSGEFTLRQPELTTTLGLARDRIDQRIETRPTFGATFRFWPDSAWSVAGNLRYTSRSSNLFTTRGLAGTVTVEAALGSGWRAGGTLNLNQSMVQSAGLVGSDVPQIFRTTDRSVFVYLRWEGSVGATAQGVGDRTPGAAGAGSLEGVVFFDANSDGRQQPGEAGVPGVEVLIDGRFRAITDRGGRFTFPLVATGRHQLSLTAETVPLPWGPAQGPGVSVEVPLRGSAETRIPVVRVGD